MVFIPLSTETWAIPAPIRPAPRMARFLRREGRGVFFGGGDKEQLTTEPVSPPSCRGKWGCHRSTPPVAGLTGQVALAAQTCSSCTVPDRGTARSAPWTQKSSRAPQNSAGEGRREGCGQRACPPLHHAPGKATREKQTGPPRHRRQRRPEGDNGWESQGLGEGPGMQDNPVSSGMLTLKTQGRSSKEEASLYVPKLSANTDFQSI